MRTHTTQRRFLRGAVGVTYGLLVGLVALAAVVSVRAGGEQVNRLFNAVAATVQPQIDDSGTLTAIGGTTSSQDGTKQAVFEQAVDFDNNTDRAKASIDALNTQTLTVSFWLRSGTPNNGRWDFVIGQSHYWSQNDWMFGYCDNNSKDDGIAFWIDSRTYGRCDASNRANVTTRDNTWHHIAGTYDGTNVILWVDGSKAGSYTTSGETVSAKRPLTINRDHGDSWKWRGDIDDVRIFDRTLTASEIDDLAQGKDVTDGLRHHWPLEEGGGSSSENVAGGPSLDLGSGVWIDDAPAP